jgi:hypothetical protein
LPHYRKYSDLSFSDGKAINQYTEQWASGDSALLYRFEFRSDAVEIVFSKKLLLAFINQINCVYSQLRHS